MVSIGVNTPSCENSRISNPIDFVAACISEGIGFSQGRRFLVKIGVIPPSQSACYKNQLRLEEETKVLGKESCLRNVIGINSPRSISFDGVWSHARNASHCMGTFIDQVTGKIIDYYKVQIDFNGHKGNYKGSSQGMETKILETLSEKWIGNEFIESICLDNDNRRSKKCEEYLMNVKKIVDTNHNYKHFRNKLTSMIKKHPSITKFGDILCKYMNFLMRNSEICLLRKHELWKNIPNHLIGNHTLCDHDDTWNEKHNVYSFTKIQEYEMNLVMQKLDKYLDKNNTNSSTKSNESFNAIRAYLCPKNRAWKNGFSPRADIAVCLFNDGHQYYFELMKRLKRPLMIWQETWLQKEIDKQTRRREYQRTEDYNQKRAERRKKTKN